ncbi:MAG: T9SS type A sorting domain-containing protein [Flavobacteriales bacterium]|nr:T9SS type A sorting domain-containing protein [Flavobacteriales bacterium]
MPSDTLDCSNLDGPAFYSLYAMDADSNISDPANLSVVTMDTLPPTIVDCPSNDTICQGDSLSSSVEFDYSDNCEIASIIYDGPEGAIEVEGDTTISQIWTVEDQSGNTSTCSTNTLVQYAPPVELVEAGLNGVTCFEVESGASPSSYIWMNGSTDFMVCVSDTQWVWVQVTFDNGCTRVDSLFADSSYFSVGLSELDAFDISLYPNPFEATFHLQSTNKIKEIYVSDMYGRDVYTKSSLNSTSHSVSLQGLPAGLYSVRLVNHDSETWILKVVKE